MPVADVTGTVCVDATTATTNVPVVVVLTPPPPDDGMAHWLAPFRNFVASGEFVPRRARGTVPLAKLSALRSPVRVPNEMSPVTARSPVNATLPVLSNVAKIDPPYACAPIAPMLGSYTHCIAHAFVSPSIP